MQAIDPKYIVKREPQYEYKELPKEGEETNETHIMHLMKAFPN
jgi:hypothetical protein